MPTPSGRRPRPKPLADILAPVLGPALAAQGFTGTDIVASWPEIVGAHLAQGSRPLKVDWPRHRGMAGSRPEPATLVVRVVGAFALEFQHSAPQILERINAHYGWRCVGRLVLKQGPVGRPTAAKPRRPEATEAQARHVAATVASIGDDLLRLALGRLGLAVSASSRSPPGEAGPDIASSFGLPQSR